MSHETAIDEPVKVWALFDSSISRAFLRINSEQVKIFPIAMSWQRRLVKFEKLILTTSRRVGHIKILTLVCASKTANYELEYNSENYMWKLKKVMPFV
ncbi:hypothetical protein A3A49_01210 [Candidatus Curtissbacteria bacterium RIFCSPLOWO2_01_FULL_38_11b]|uniref:Uncharacterized protein n=1 Tax=Candidatus Curtissbacteria bacterium RIFCSPLOWO2_01_FULL_38_11b TaxID=1797725 RepID=A0A1F5GZL8_9BACT|nr:MAG: hypothetical protein A3A49_01210 [Candidatus Curtissbacteria bacterium RIFCSPLOWO2_01_FULL_38_11b]